MIGLDIGSKTIKLIETEKAKGQKKLKASGIVGHNNITPDKAQEDKDLKPLSETIKNLHKEAKVSSKYVALSLPEQQIFTRTIQLPLLTDSEIASAVKWEAEQYIPIPVEEAVVQHQTVEKRQNMSPPSVIVLLVAAPKELVQKYSKVAEMAGLNVVVAESELMALVRSLAPADQTSMIIDIGANSTDIAISKNRQLVFSRSLNTAGEAFTRAVSQGLGIEMQQAEEYKRTYGMATDQLEGKVAMALQPIFNVLIEEVKKSIHFHQTESKGGSPRTILLSGGTAALPGISTAMTRALNIEVVVGNPFARMQVDPQAMSSLSKFAPLYSIASGLALREV